MSIAKPPAPARPSSSFTTLISIGVVVIAAGMLLPRMLSLSPVPAQSATEETIVFSPPVEKTPLADKATPSTTLPTTPSLTTPHRAEESSLIWVLVKLIFGLAIVAAACIGVARWTNRSRTIAPPGILESLARLAIDQRCVVHLVGAGSRRLLVGIDATGVKVVLELPPR